MAPLLSKSRGATLLLAATLTLTTACRGKHSRVTVENEEPPEGGPRIASALKMNDPAAPAQLIKGFSGVESGTWRWTAKNFSAILRPPLTAAQRGATLTFSLSIPDVVIQRLSSVTLSASSGTTKLKSETYSKPGSYTFSADVPPDLLIKDAITIDFALDKAIPPGTTDSRELGIIALAIGLEAK
jgi:hypothetical protein